MTWAQREVLLYRARLSKKGLKQIPLDDDEIISLIGMIWARVVAGDIRSFRPDAGKPVVEQVNAYVAKCLDHEVQRYMRQEGSLAPVHVPRGEKTPFASPLASDWESADDESNGSEHQNLICHSDPQQILMDRESLHWHGQSAWPGPVGPDLSHWIEQAREKSSREARAIRCCVHSGTSYRANMAWIVTQLAYDRAPARAYALAPMLCQRWVNHNNIASKKLLRQIYPGLRANTLTVKSIAGREARNLLRFLAVESSRDATITALHLDLVSQDAQSAMAKWVGKRGPYQTGRKKPENADGSCAQEALSVAA